jgi:ubiquinone/menaquinone biosynthesis C-methylase UbiE
VPVLDFYDASTLNFDDESMDFVYSAVTIRFMKKKIEFIEEVARVLRPGERLCCTLESRTGTILTALSATSAY